MLKVFGRRRTRSVAVPKVIVCWPKRPEARVLQEQYREELESMRRQQETLRHAAEAARQAAEEGSARPACGGCRHS